MDRARLGWNDLLANCHRRKFYFHRDTRQMQARPRFAEREISTLDPTRGKEEEEKGQTRFV